MPCLESREAFLTDSANVVKLGDPADPTGPGGLADEAGSFVNDADVSLTAITAEADGADLSGTLSLPVDLDYLVGSNGVYTAIIPIGASIANGQRALLRVEVSENGELSRVFSLAVYGESG